MSATYLTPEKVTSRLINHSLELAATDTQIVTEKINWWKRFLNFSSAQEKNRFGWLAIGITLQACVLAPLTLLTLMLTGSPFLLWIPCILAFAVTEVVNLAAMPTRITIPVIFAGVLLDLFVVIAAFTLF